MAATILQRLYDKPFTEIEVAALQDLVIGKSIDTEDLLIVLHELTGLKKLSLTNIDLDIPSFCTVIPKGLHTLVLQSNGIDAAGAHILASVFPALKELQRFWLIDNKIGDEGISALITTLPSLRNLKSLHLVGNNIGNDGARMLASVCPTLTNLEYLWLGDNTVGDEGISALAAFLPSLIKLKNLNLIKNKIGDAGAVALATGVSSMSIVSVNLSENLIKNSGAEALIDSFSKMKKLKLVSLNENPIEDKQLKEFKSIFHYYLTNHVKRGLLGKGHFGTVHLYELPASRVKTEKRVGAVKISKDLRDAEREALMLEKFTPTGIFPALYAYGVDGVDAYIFMEYSEGDTLHNYLRYRIPIPEKEGLESRIKEQVNKLHILGYIHNDLKPANIYVKSDGSIQLLDAGSVRLQGSFFKIDNAPASTSGYCKRKNQSYLCETYEPELNAYSLEKINKNIAERARGGTRRQKSKRLHYRRTKRYR